MNKYYQILGKVLSSGKMQSNKKGNIRYLLNEQLTLLPADLLDIFEGHTIARKKLKNELQITHYSGGLLRRSYPPIWKRSVSTPVLIEKEKYWHDREMCATVS